ncbi:class I SAM-dependent methyltransferase [candidate division WOR-3 bacterium]|nr:class I SAM-dependent methyltransferase [candidate division WOR-3 bacterium]
MHKRDKEGKHMRGQMHPQQSYDKKTKVFFDSQTPEYPTEWFNYLLGFVQRTSTKKSTLIDIGCGSGNVLLVFREKTKIKRCVGVDVSTQLIKKARNDYKLEAYEGSVFDHNLCDVVGSNYDYVILGQILHHLVGKTRNQSKGNARKALLSAMRLLQSGGYLLIYEPTYYPSLPCDIIFWIKRFVTSFSMRRIDILRKFHNIGAPVVSFLTHKELKVMIQHIPDCRIKEWISEPWHVTWIKRLGLIGSEKRISCVVQKGR